MVSLEEYISTDENLKLIRYPERTGVIYIRVSSQQQVDNFSIPTQIEHCRRYFEREKIREVGIFIEKGESAKTTDRTELAHLLNFICRNKFKVDFVLVYKIDRWTRNQADFFAIKSILTRNGTTLTSATENLDDTPTGRFLESIFAGLAELDNALKGERVRACLATKALDGHWPGKPPYGYINHPEKKILIEDPHYFNVINQVLHDFLNGVTIPEIVNELNYREITTGGFNKRPKRYFIVKDIWKILTHSRFYAGYFDWGEQKNVLGKHPTMLSWEEHLLIQSMLRHKNMKVTKELQEDTEHFILNFTITNNTGFIHCYECETRLRTCFAQSKTGRKYPYYFCKNPKCKAEKKSILNKKLERLMEDYLAQIKPTSEYMDLLKHRVMYQWEHEYKFFDERKKLAQERLRILVGEEDELITMKRKRQLNDEQYETQMDKITNQIAATRAEVNDNLVEREELETLLAQAELFMTRIDILYRSFSTPNKRRFLTFIFPDGVKYKDGILRTQRKSLLFRLIDDIQTEKNINVQKLTSRRIELRLPD